MPNVILKDWNLKTAMTQHFHITQRFMRENALFRHPDVILPLFIFFFSISKASVII